MWVVTLIILLSTVLKTSKIGHSLQSQKSNKIVVNSDQFLSGPHIMYGLQTGNYVIHIIPSY